MGLSTGQSLLGPSDPLSEIFLPSGPVLLVSRNKACSLSENGGVGHGIVTHLFHVETGTGKVQVRLLRTTAARRSRHVTQNPQAEFGACLRAARKLGGERPVTPAAPSSCGGS